MNQIDRKERATMEKARMLKKEEISQLQRGKVVWRESHTALDCGKYGKVDSYNIYPMLVSVPGENGILGYIDNETEVAIEIGDISGEDCFWSKEPDLEQLKNGMPIDEALKIFNKYEAEECALK